ncbi:hypothetical protein ABC382_00805 [Lysinibacillus sp. 1P01SD]|uniref:hypothetical protein n=1 Tax=Lysinibacillus sp. 1P01SD TaxID=3132285 RepID=UPI0039A23CC5
MKQQSAKTNNLDFTHHYFFILAIYFAGVITFFVGFYLTFAYPLDTYITVPIFIKEKIIFTIDSHSLLMLVASIYIYWIVLFLVFSLIIYWISYFLFDETPKFIKFIQTIKLTFNYILKLLTLGVSIAIALIVVPYLISLLDEPFVSFSFLLYTCVSISIYNILYPRIQRLLSLIFKNKMREEYR